MHPPETLTREDLRSLAYHEVVARHVRKNPQAHLAHALHNINKWRIEKPTVAPLFDRWQQWLQLPVPEMLTLMLSHSQTSRDMRQVSPFSGILSARERRDVLLRFRKGQE